MYESRLITKNARPKPKVVMDKRFGFLRDLDVGDIGQMETNLKVQGISLEMDDTGNERITFDLVILNAELINNVSNRI